MSFLSPRALSILLFCSLCWGTGPLLAAEVEGLYEAVVPVAGQSAGERSRAMTEGFRQVLVKVSGQRAVLTMPAVQAEVPKAESLVGAYRYETVAPRQPGQVVDGGPLRIRLSFDPASVRAILNRAGAAVWGASRPAVYLWVTRDNGSSHTLFPLGTAQGDVLLSAAAQRGLPAAIPAPGDVAAGDSVLATVPPAIADAAGRAGAKVVLAASISGTAGRLRGAGVVSVEGSIERIDATAGDEAAVLRELVAQTADHLGAKYAVVARQDQLRLVRLRVSGVDTLVRHAGLERWLAGLPLVKDVVIEQVSGERVDYLLTLAGDVERLQQAMTADGRFASLSAPSADGSAQVIDAVLAGTRP